LLILPPAGNRQSPIGNLNPTIRNLNRQSAIKKSAITNPQSAIDLFHIASSCGDFPSLGLQFDLERVPACLIDAPRSVGNEIPSAEFHEHSARR
jgi:hypothetical protein